MGSALEFAIDHASRVPQTLTGVTGLPTSIAS
jgi:hypothetical protein